MLVLNWRIPFSSVLQLLKKAPDVLSSRFFSKILMLKIRALAAIFEG